ncbi:hypothetical protein COCC4DRAFT_149663 [Bipolaris maydis ATCC 48331]|uniref:DUF7514 domain-containing protein n=2 Tax=Cochliobolus heterostrophus TaxID=5016 RepID=M2UKF5_COCH5|nr:uncharacterized protein COCC4DRAFT_149663 [Bipolaris maydis ATCC 48331]EMD88412.1 hypothetical protein COCHEDRAFT_1181383 [Bipolaris maydis C5]ENI00748.1 hypothetical protein COCC4DRAFT_149663 [Bipolaris maydis ATCC 48331]
MATEPAQQEEHAANTANATAAHREAYDYWGYLFQEDKCGTRKLDGLLRGIAEVISNKFEPSDSPDLTPSQIAAWYRSVGGDYDVLFTDTPPSSIAFIYRSLGAYHSLQPAADDDGYSSPTIPALKKQGFVTWQTIQLLLGPEEHVPFLQRAVELDDIPDPETGNPFPKILPKECFPDKPDDAMEAWYHNVAARLKKEAEEEANEGSTDEARLRSSTEYEPSSADEKHGAFRYFEDPLYRNERPRPTFMRHVMKQSARPVDDRDRAVTSRVRHMLNPLNPFASRKKTMPGRSHDAPAAQPGYFPAYHEARRYSNQHETVRVEGRSSTATSPQPVYRPTTSPLFATQVAHAQQEARKYYERRPAMPPRTSYRPVPAPHSGVRWGSPTLHPVPPSREGESAYVREREHQYREREGHDGGSSSGRSHRRHSTDVEYPRERDRDSDRRRSHDRAKDEWDDRDYVRSSRNGSRDRDRDRDRDRERDRERDRGRDPRMHSVRGQIVRLLKEF